MLSDCVQGGNGKDSSTLPDSEGKPGLGHGNSNVLVFSCKVGKALAHTHARLPLGWPVSEGVDVAKRGWSLEEGGRHSIFIPPGAGKSRAMDLSQLN